MSNDPTEMIDTLREMLPPQTLSIILLTISIIVVTRVDAQNEYIVEKSFYPKYSMSDLLPALKGEGSL